MNTEISLDKPKEEQNYFYHFNFSKFKKIVPALVIITFLLILKQFIANNFYIPHSNPLLDSLNLINAPKQLPPWAEILDIIINIMIMIVAVCWEAVSEKKYDKIKYLLLLCLPSIFSQIIAIYSDINETFTKSSFFWIYFILNYLPYFATYGAFRGKILYGKKVSLLGYFIGLFVLVSISALYQKLGSVLLFNDFFIPILSYGMALTKVIILLSFFYFIFLADAGFSFKNFIKLPPTVLLTNKKFTAHFIFLFTFLFANYLNFKENFSESWFRDLSLNFLSIYNTIYSLIYIIAQIAVVYLLFSQLLLLQLSALRRRPLWIYLISFMPIVNLFPLLLFFRKSKPLNSADFSEMEEIEDQRKSYLQLFILLFSTAYAIYRFIGLGLSRENLIYLISAFLVLYIVILYFRIGVWIALALLGLTTVFVLYQDLPTGLYYTCIFSYGAIGLYNLHISLFWTAEEWEKIDENIVTENIQEV
ncbi:hypothetical protein [Flavobacterium sp. KACC 22761]|uniref:hypothetical protein n=1 Tax=Flavobacterium sp. KACC 22761 TaxID=3092665 RepID=UPI002A7499CA|nr:hypothetical protein [Flavobacterium sp. KACC 22761]WPO79998.1 hypothetical protein SCB73_06355 [Flavobacterium sp. KACC 22761]